MRKAVDLISPRLQHGWRPRSRWALQEDWRCCRKKILRNIDLNSSNRSLKGANVTDTISHTKDWETEVWIDYHHRSWKRSNIVHACQASMCQLWSCHSTELKPAKDSCSEKDRGVYIQKSKTSFRLISIKLSHNNWRKKTSSPCSVLKG